MRNFFGITPPHVFVRNAWPRDSFGDSGSMQARFGGDNLLSDFFDESNVSSRPRFFNDDGVFGVNRPLAANEMTDGRLLNDELISRIDCDNFGFSFADL